VRPVISLAICISESTSGHPRNRGLLGCPATFCVEGLRCGVRTLSEPLRVSAEARVSTMASSRTVDITLGYGAKLVTVPGRRGFCVIKSGINKAGNGPAPGTGTRVTTSAEKRTSEHIALQFAVAIHLSGLPGYSARPPVSITIRCQVPRPYIYNPPMRLVKTTGTRKYGQGTRRAESTSTRRMGPLGSPNWHAMLDGA
jgi:hypothetical protein